MKNKYMLNNCVNCVCISENYECSDKDFEVIKDPLVEKECFNINPFSAAERYEVIAKENESLRVLLGEAVNCLRKIEGDENGYGDPELAEIFLDIYAERYKRFISSNEQTEANGDSDE